MESACGRRKCEDLDNDARSVFFYLKFGQILKLFFFVFRKISAIFLGLTNFQLFLFQMIVSQT